MMEKRKLDAMYWTLAAIKDHIYNVKNGSDMWDYAFGIRYKDGTTIEVVGNELPEERIIIGRQKIAYCYESNPDDASDSNGKSWQKDFLKDMQVGELGAWETLAAWNEYVASNMYDVEETA